MPVRFVHATRVMDMYIPWNILVTHFVAFLVLISWRSSRIFAISASRSLAKLLKEVDAFICEFILDG